VIQERSVAHSIFIEFCSDLKIGKANSNVFKPVIIFLMHLSFGML
jgi:hypothetical protein